MTGLPAVLWNLAFVLVPGLVLFVAIRDRKHDGRRGTGVVLVLLGIITALMAYQFIANAVEVYQLRRIATSAVVELQIGNRAVSSPSDVTSLVNGLNGSQWYVRWNSPRAGELPVRIRLRDGAEYEFVLRRDTSSNVVVVDSTMSPTHNLSHGYAASPSLLTALKNAGYSL